MQAGARRCQIKLSTCIPVRPLVCSTPARCRSFAVLSEAQRARTLPQAFWRYKAAELEGPVPGTSLIRDPYAKQLVEALLPRTELDELQAISTPEAERLATIEGIRCAFMDRFIMDSLKQRMRQVVIIGSGMDSRVFRLEVPPQMTIVEVDEGAVHEVKCVAAESAGARARCLVRRQAVSLDAGLQSTQLLDAIDPVFNRQKPGLFLLDGALTTWPAEARLPALAAAAELAGTGSVIVGPAPGDDVAPLLQEAGFGQVNTIVHQQLSNIYRRAVPESMKMLVAIHGPAPKGGGCSGGAGSKSSGPPSRAKEIRF